MNFEGICIITKNRNRPEIEEYNNGNGTAIISMPIFAASSHIINPVQQIFGDGNPERAAEEAKAREREERRFTTYLGQSSAEVFLQNDRSAFAAPHTNVHFS